MNRLAIAAALLTLAGTCAHAQEAKPAKPPARSERIIRVKRPKDSGPRVDTLRVHDTVTVTLVRVDTVVVLATNNVHTFTLERMADSSSGGGFFPIPIPVPIPLHDRCEQHDSNFTPPPAVGPPATVTPEPATLGLVAIGGGFLGLIAWKRRK